MNSELEPQSPELPEWAEATRSEMSDRVQQFKKDLSQFDNELIRTEQYQKDPEVWDQLLGEAYEMSNLKRPDSQQRQFKPYEPNSGEAGGYYTLWTGAPGQGPMIYETGRRRADGAEDFVLRLTRKKITAGSE